MKIVITAPEHPNSPNHGGIARYLKDYLAELKNHAEVILISVEDGKPIDGVEQIILRPGGPSPIAPRAWSKEVNQHLSIIKPDCVEHANYRGLGSVKQNLCASVCRLSTPIVSGSLRPGIMPRIARPMHHYWELRTVKNVDLWISNTKENLKKCEAVYKQIKDNVVIPHGIDLPIIERQILEPKLLFVGRFEDRKGVDHLLTAWKDLKESGNYPEAELHLVGRDTPGVSGSYLQDCINTAGIDPSMFINHQDLSDQELTRLRQDMSISIIPSRYESFGMVVLEANAFGHLVLASEVGGLKEIIQDGKTGCLFKVNNASAIGAMLRKVLSNLAAYQSIAKCGQLELIDSFSIHTMVQRSLKAYEKAVTTFRKK